MADGKTGKTLNLTEGNPLKLILLFAIPVFLGRLFQMMYSLIDTKIVGSILGEEALAAVGSVSILYNLLTGIFSGFTLGFSIVTAQNYGSGNEKLLKKNVASSIILGMMTAVVIIFAVLLFLNPILHAMNVPEEQFCMAHDYIRILVWGMFVTLAYNLCADMLRAIGDSVTPLIFLVIAAVTNIVLDSAAFPCACQELPVRRCCHNWSQQYYAFCVSSPVSQSFTSRRMIWSGTENA